MANLILLFSHTLTDEQWQDAQESLGVKSVIALPPELQDRWSNIPPEPETIMSYVRPVAEWLQTTAVPGDFVVVQGDFGAVYALVTLALQWHLIPVYATTKRRVVETPQPDGAIQVQRTFRHVRFRRYAPVTIFVEE